MTALLTDLYAALDVTPEPGLAAEALPPSGVTSSAAVSEPGSVPVDVASLGPARANGESGTVGSSGMAALTSSQLRSIVSAARHSRGHKRLRWEPRQRRAWDELNRRGMAA